MKYFKISMITLIVAVIANVAITIAGTNAVVKSLTLNYALDKNNSSYTGYYEKETYDYMTYKHNKSYTWLTNPCNDCIVSVRLYAENGSYSSAYLTTMNHTYTLNDNEAWAWPTRYELKLTRYDSTLLTTNHEAVWYINE